MPNPSLKSPRRSLFSSTYLWAFTCNRSIEKYKKKPFLTHSHTDASNFRLRDAINKPEELIDYCHEIGLSGVVITDHETLSSHVKAFTWDDKVSWSVMTTPLNPISWQ